MLAENLQEILRFLRFELCDNSTMKKELLKDIPLSDNFIGTVLTKKDPVESFWKLIVNIIIRLRHDYSKLSQEALILFDILDFDREVINGGFHQYFFNSSGGRAQMLRKALLEVNAHITLQIFEKSLKIFPENFQFENTDLRQNFLRISTNSEEAFFAFDVQYEEKIKSRSICPQKTEDLWQICHKYIETNKDVVISIDTSIFI